MENKYDQIEEDIIIKMVNNNHIYYNCTSEMYDDEFFKIIQSRLNTKGYIISRNKINGKCFVTRKRILLDGFLIILLLILIVYLTLNM